MHQCNYCSYQSSRKYNLRVHERNKHGIVPASTSFGGRAPPTMAIQPYPQPYPSHATNTAQVVQPDVPRTMAFQPHPTSHPSHTNNTVVQPGVPQAVSTELFNRYRNALVDTIREKEDLRNENIELVRHRDEILDKMSNDFSRLYHRYKDSRKEVKEILKC